MARDRFGLREEPFAATTDERFFYSSKDHEGIFDGFLLAILAQRRLLVLTGEPGAGKTVMLNKLISHVAADGSLVLAVTAQSGMSVEDLITSAGPSLLHGQPRPLGSASDQEIDRLVTELEAQLEQAGTGLLAIDNAHVLDVTVLRDLVELARTDTEHGRFLQVMMAGRPELERHLADPALASAMRALGVLSRLTPLDGVQVGGLIAHRLRVAGAHEGLFEPAAIAKAAKVSGGLPGQLLPVCAAALDIARATGAPTVTAPMIGGQPAAGSAPAAEPPVAPPEFSTTMPPGPQAVSLRQGSEPEDHAAPPQPAPAARARHADMPPSRTVPGRMPGRIAPPAGRPRTGQTRRSKRGMVWAGAAALSVLLAVGLALAPEDTIGKFHALMTRAVGTLSDAVSRDGTADMVSQTARPQLGLSIPVTPFPESAHPSAPPAVPLPPSSTITTVLPMRPAEAPDPAPDPAYERPAPMMEQMAVAAMPPPAPAMPQPPELPPEPPMVRDITPQPWPGPLNKPLNEPFTEPPGEPPALEGTSMIAPAMPEAPPPPVKPQTDEKAQKAQRLIERAQRQISAKRLTSPGGDNAFETYRQLKVLMPGHPGAPGILATIKDTYQRWGDQAEKRGDWEQARRFYERAREVDPGDQAMRDLLDTLEIRQRMAELAAEPPETPPEPASAPPVSLTPPSSLTPPPVSLSPPPGQPGPDMPADTADAPKRGIGFASREAMVSAFRRPDVLRAVIATGRDFNRPFPDGKTPLMIAAEGGYVEAVQLLLRSGARADTRSPNGATALMYGAWDGNGEIISLLIDAGADPDTANLDGKTALMAASMLGHSAAVRALLDHGATVDRATSQGWTALMYAAQAGHADLVRLLLSRGANAAAVNSQGLSAVAVASAEGHGEVVRALQNR